MTDAEFKRYVRGLYRPPLEIPSDDRGGYLVPEIISVDRVGLLATLYRFLGRKLRNTKMYERGTRKVNLYKQIVDATRKETR